MSRPPKTTTSALVGRTIRSNSRSLLALGVLTLLLAFGAVVLPPVVTGLLTRGLQHDLGQSTFIERDLTAKIPYSVTVDPAGTATTDLTGPLAKQWGGFDSAAQSLRDRLPEPLRSATEAPEYNVTSEQLSMVVSLGAIPKYLQLTTDPRLFERITVDSGRRPAPIPTGATSFGVLLAAGNAERMNWKVGEVRHFTVGEDFTLAVRLTGTYRINDRSDPYWRQTYNVDPLTGAAASAATTVEATAFVDPLSLPALSAYPFGFQTRLWYPTRLSAISPATAGRIAEQTGHFSATAHRVADAGTAPIAFTSSLVSLLDASEARTTTALSVVAAIFVGPLGAALALLLLVIRLALLQGKKSIDLVAGRGASPLRLRLVVALLAGLASVPAAALGAIAGSWWSGSPPGSGLWGTAGLAALLPPLVGLLLVPSTFPRRRRFRVRSFLEVVLVLGTLVAVVLTLRRSAAADSVSADVDPVTIALPLLLAVTGCVVTARLVPLLLGRALPRLRRRPGIAAFTGAAFVARGSGGTAVTLLAALVAVSVALFGSIFSTTLARGLETAGMASVGSSLSVAADTLDDDVVERVQRQPGVAASVGLTNEQAISVSNRGQQVNATVIIADTTALARVQRGVPGTFPIPAALRADGSTVPVIVSQGLADRLGGASATVDGTPLRVVATAPSQTALTTSASWILVDSGQASLLNQQQGSPNQVLLRLGPKADPVSVAAGTARIVGDPALVTTEQSAIDRLEKNPLVPGMRSLAVVASILAGVIGILALLVAAFQETPVRRARIALLSMLGLDRGQGRRIMAVESLPLGVGALVGGAAVAAAIIAVVLPSIDLRSFTGSATRPPVALEPLELAAILIGGLAAVGVVALFTIRITTITSGDRRLSEEE